MTAECDKRIGYVIYDCVCLSLGATEARSRITDNDAEKIAAAARPIFQSLKQPIVAITEKEDRYTIATQVFDIVAKLYSSGLLADVIKVWVGTLTAADALRYGANAFKTILASMCTDGAALIGIIVIEIATFDVLITDAIECSKSCSYA